MKLQIFEYKCEPFGHEFHAPRLPFNSYGEFILRDEAGVSMAYLNAMEDSTYKEVEAILKGQPGVDRMTPNKRAELLRRVYGPVACDVSTDGRVLKIGQHPKCPECSSSTMRSWQEVQPAEFVELDIPSVTHALWQSLTEGQKVARISQWMFDQHA